MKWTAHKTMFKYSDQVIKRKEKDRKNLTIVHNKSKDYPARPLSQFRKGGEVTLV